MSLLHNQERLRYYAPVVVCLVLIALLLALPTGFEGALIYQGADRCAARVLSTDDSAILDTGLVRSGEQVCTLELLGGKFRGRTVQGHNLLNGSLEQDKIFAPGDRALVVISYRGDEILTVTMTDHYRLDKESALAAAFALLLILFAGKTGLRAIASFMLTILMLWKVLIPLYLKGYNPILVGLAVTLVLTVLILSQVYGFDRRAAAAERVGLRVNFHVDNRRKCGKISAISKKTALKNRAFRSAFREKGTVRALQQARPAASLERPRESAAGASRYRSAEICERMIRVVPRPTSPLYKGRGFMFLRDPPPLQPAPQEGNTYQNFGCTVY